MRTAAMPTTSMPRDPNNPSRQERTEDDPKQRSPVDATENVGPNPWAVDSDTESGQSTTDTVTPRPSGPTTRGELEVVSREEALRLFPKGTTVGREFVDSEGKSKVWIATVLDYSDPYWRVEYPDGDWEELTKREMDAGVGAAARRSFAA